jgi:hypothetical protein
MLQDPLVAALEEVLWQSLPINATSPLVQILVALFDYLRRTPV